MWREALCRCETRNLPLYRVQPGCRGGQASVLPFLPGANLLLQLYACLGPHRKDSILLLMLRITVWTEQKQPFMKITEEECCFHAVAHPHHLVSGCAVQGTTCKTAQRLPSSTGTLPCQRYASFAFFTA